jgi:ribosomal protein S25
LSGDKHRALSHAKKKEVEEMVYFLLYKYKVIHIPLLSRAAKISLGTAKHYLRKFCEEGKVKKVEYPIKKNYISLYILPES